MRMQAGLGPRGSAAKPGRGATWSAQGGDLAWVGEVSAAAMAKDNPANVAKVHLRERRGAMTPVWRDMLSHGFAGAVGKCG